MTRPLAIFSAAAILAAAAQAQCLTNPAPGTSVAPGMVPWNGFDGLASLEPLDDEGITSPPIAFTAFPSFPMAGAVGTLDRMIVGTNGVIYLVDSTLALSEPVGGDSYGFFDLATMRGGPAGSARIVPCGDDMEGSPTGVWDIVVDQSVAGQVTVSWVDVTRWNLTDQFSFRATLFASGAVQFDYGTVPADTRSVGISIGNDVGTAASPSLDLTGGADSGAEGLLYEAMTTATWDLSNTSIFIAPNGGGGYLSTVLCEPASHTEFGVGCHTYNIVSPTESFYEFYADAAVASAALQGNAMILAPTGPGYTASYVPGGAGALFVAPTGAATSLPTTDDGSTLVTLPSAFPTPAGSFTDISVSHNGIITMGTVSNNDFDFSPSGTDFAAASGAAFYTWSDFRDTSGVSPGTIKTEAVGNIFYVTWDGVDHWTSSPQVAAPCTIQFQLDLSTGVVTYVWQTIDTNTTSTFGSQYLVGYNGPGVGNDPGSIVLATALPIVTSNNVAADAMTLSASPAPVINPSTNVAYVVDNIPEFIPGSGVYLATLFLSVTPNPAGFDLSLIGLTTVPGCNAWIGSLDVDLGAMITGTPTATWNFTFDNVVFAPGNTIAAQAVGVFDPSFPQGNGEAGGFLMSNGVQSTTQTN